MFAVMSFIIDDWTLDDLAGLPIGFVVAVAHLAVGNVSGASFNPARTLGPYVTNSLLGGPNFWTHTAICVVGPVAGTVAIAYEKIVLTPYQTRDKAVQGARRTNLKTDPWRHGRREGR